MEDLPADEPVLERDGPLRVVQLQGQWHVVGHGYLCLVDGYGQGVQLIERLRAEAERHTR